jgi:hypothetical protein
MTLSFAICPAFQFAAIAADDGHAGKCHENTPSVVFEEPLSIIPRHTVHWSRESSIDRRDEAAATAR